MKGQRCLIPVIAERKSLDDKLPPNSNVAIRITRLNGTGLVHHRRVHEGGCSLRSQLSSPSVGERVDRGINRPALSNSSMGTDLVTAFKRIAKRVKETQQNLLVIPYSLMLSLRKVASNLPGRRSFAEAVDSRGERSASARGRSVKNPPPVIAPGTTWRKSWIGRR